MNNLKPYTKYKPSNIAWLGDIPEHWEVRKLKYSILVNQHRNFDKEESSFSKIALENIESKTGKLLKVVTIPFEGVGTIFKKGDVLFGKLRPYLAKVAAPNFEGNCVNEILVLSPNKNMWETDFLKYRILSSDFIKIVDDSTYGSKMPRASWSFIGGLKVSSPPLEEQTAIANFLDYKLAKIDRFIQKKKQLIKLLNEQKAGIINDAVTKGLNPNAKMKPSGIEWLGDIPEHWEVVKLIGVCDLVRGNSSFKKDELLSSGKYVALQYGKTYKVNEVDENYQFYVNDEFYKVSQIVNYGDVIFISTSETVKDLGHSVFYNRNDLGLLGGEQILLRPKINLVSGKYLCYSSKMFAKELKKYATGVKVYRFNISDLKTVYTSVPPFQEQQQIVSYIEQETAQINAVIQTIEKEIALTQEYRVALIAEAVTGKIDVRAYEIPETPVMELYEELEDEMSLAAEEEVGYSTEN